MLQDLGLLIALNFVELKRLLEGEEVVVFYLILFLVVLKLLQQC